MLFIVYGQQKSASTYLAHLTRQCCAATGVSPDEVKSRVLTGPLKKNRTFWSGDLSAVPEVADKLGPKDHMLIKTHVQFNPSYSEILDRPDIKVLISYRHPGDAALSAFEAGERARNEDKNWPFFASIHSHREGIDVMARLLDRATIPWLKSGLGTAFSYDQVTQESDKILETLRGFLGLSRAQLEQNEELQELLSGEKRVYNFNKGVAGRHREVFSQEDLDYLEQRCGPFIRFCNGEIGVQDL